MKIDISFSGTKFNIKEFHSIVLESGTVSLNVLEKMIDDWIENHKPIKELPVGCADSAFSRVVPLILFSVVLSVNNL